MLAGICRFRPFFPAQLHAGAMALAIARGAATAIDELTCFIVVKGGRLDGPVPNRRAVFRLLKGLEHAGTRRVAKPR